jgi:hypothetical protein
MIIIMKMKTLVKLAESKIGVTVGKQGIAVLVAII